MGNFMEIQMGSASQQAPEAPKYVGIQDELQHGGSITVTSSGGFHQEEPTTVNVGEGEADFNGDPVLSTLKTKTGRPLNDMTKLDGATVTVGGVEMSIQAAINVGLLSKGADGTISGTGKSKGINDGKKQQQQQAQHSNSRAVDTRPISNELNEMRAKLGDWGVDQQVSQAISQVVLGKDAGATMEALSRATGKSATEVHRVVDNAIRGTQARAIAHLDRAGYDGSAMMKYLHSQVRPDARASILNRLYLGDASALNDIVQKYKLNNR
jgi:hypothetical protein